jgi:hypothetical protein
VNTNSTNPFFNTKSQNLINGVVKTGDGKEDSFGIAKISNIVDDNGNYLYQDSPNHELTAIFYGFDDIYMNGSGTTARVLTTGGHADFYLDSTPDYILTNPPNAKTDRSGSQGQYMKNVTDGTLVLSLDAHKLWDSTVGAFYTMDETFNFSTLSGTGTVATDVTGGTGQVSIIRTRWLTDQIWSLLLLPSQFRHMLLIKNGR